MEEQVVGCHTAEPAYPHPHPTPWTFYLHAGFDSALHATQRADRRKTPYYSYHHQHCRLPGNPHLRALIRHCYSPTTSPFSTIDHYLPLLPLPHDRQALWRGIPLQEDGHGMVVGGFLVLPAVTDSLYLPPSARRGNRALTPGRYLPTKHTLYSFPLLPKHLFPHDILPTRAAFPLPATPTTTAPTFSCPQDRDLTHPTPHRALPPHRWWLIGRMTSMVTGIWTGTNNSNNRQP